MEGLNTGGGGPDLFSKIGPLPAWGWASLAVGGYLVWTHLHPASSPVESDGTDNIDTGYSDENSGTVTDYGGSSDPLSGVDAGYNYADVLSGEYAGNIGGTTFTSNQQWGIYAIQALIAHGTSAATATSGITHYLAGSSLTSDEATAVTEAITLVGPPPLPLPLSTIGAGTSGTTSSGDTVGTTAPAPTTTAPAPTTSTVTRYGAFLQVSLSSYSVRKGTPIVVSVKVTGFSGADPRVSAGPTPTGTVTFSGLVSKTVTLMGGSASFSFTPSASGTLDATYNGDAAHSGSHWSGGVQVS